MIETFKTCVMAATSGPKDLGLNVSTTPPTVDRSISETNCHCQELNDSLANFIEMVLGEGIEPPT